MEILDCSMAGLKVIKLELFHDERGFFMERFHAERFAAAGLPYEFAQENHSYSRPSVLRGLHYQHKPAQGKLVGVTRGRVWDVAVDIRAESPSFGQHYGVELSGENGTLLWIPAGFAHGFCVLGDAPADVLYHCTKGYHKIGEGGIAFDSLEMPIDWPVHNPVISARDKSLPSWQEYCANPAFL